MRIMAIVNQKGGSGKTTTAVNLSAALAETGRRVLLIDLDSQSSASSWYGVRDGGRGLLDAFTSGRGLAELIRPTSAPGVELIAASSWLVGAERALSGEVGAEVILRRLVAQLPADRWDYLLVDCAPALSLLTVNALAAAREVLVPVEAHVMALGGLAQLRQTAELIQERLNPELSITGILACRLDGRTRHGAECVEQLRERFGALVYRTAIRENVRVAEAPSFGLAITQYDSRSTAAADYRALAQEVLSQEEERRKQAADHKGES